MKKPSQRWPRTLLQLCVVINIVSASFLLARLYYKQPRPAEPSPQAAKVALVKDIKERRLTLDFDTEDMEDVIEEDSYDFSAAEMPSNFLQCDDEDLANCLVCQADYDCPEGQACRLDPATHKVRCVNSRCAQHSDCPEGHQCVRIDDASVGEVYGCERTGPRSRGQTCTRYDVLTACGMGLECLGGLCRGPCSDGCAEDEACVEINDRRVCVSASCEGVDCPYGDQRCVAGQCVRGLDCRTDTCPEGGVCLTTGKGLSWTGACYQPCSPWKPCAEGEVCDAFGVCLHECDPRDHESCAEGFQCQSSPEMPGVWGCSPQ